jgi:hypothetical protein
VPEDSIRTSKHASSEKALRCAILRYSHTLNVRVQPRGLCLSQSLQPRVLSFRSDVRSREASGKGPGPLLQGQSIRFEFHAPSSAPRTREASCARYIAAVALVHDQRQSVPAPCAMGRGLVAVQLDGVHVEAMSLASAAASFLVLYIFASPRKKPLRAQ